MKSSINMVLFILLILLPIGGCTIHHQARLYDLETGNVILVNSRIRGNRAITEAVLPNGVHCRGECVSGGEGFASFGGAYSSANLFSSWGNIYGYGFTSYSSTTIPLSQRGVGVSICDDGTTMECEYRVMSFAVQGHGICRDNRGKYYRLIF
jgi:hypothetical protein